MRLQWSGIARVILWTSLMTTDGGTIRLVVEPLPDGAWDWAAWRDGCGTRCCYGVGNTPARAVAAAEAAALRLASRSTMAGITD